MDNKSNIVAINAIVRIKTKILILKRGMHEIAYPGKWAFPGGKLEPKETILQGLIREVQEETNLKIHPKKRYINDFTFVRPDNINVVGITFEVEPIEEDAQVKISEDFDDFAWVNPKDLGNYDCIPGMFEDAQLCALNNTKKSNQEFSINRT